MTPCHGPDLTGTRFPGVVSTFLERDPDMFANCRVPLSPKRARDGGTDNEPDVAERSRVFFCEESELLLHSLLDVTRRLWRCPACDVRQ